MRHHPLSVKTSYRVSAIALEGRQESGYWSPVSKPMSHLIHWICVIKNFRTSLVLQWIRIRTANAGDTGPPVWEDSTCHGATELCRVPHLLSLRSRAHKLQLLKPTSLKPVLHNRRSRLNEKPPPAATRKPACSNEGPAEQKKKQNKYFKDSVKSQLLQSKY